jgi:two-component system, NarL family, nitrate/nitrite response regulator NarL
MDLMRTRRMSDTPTSVAPLIPGTPEQLVARRSAMRNLLTAVSDALSSGDTTVLHTLLDDLATSFPVPVMIEIDWDQSRSEGHPIIQIRTVRASRERVLQQLSPRQRDVARLLEEGLTNAEMANRLGISIATVKDHVHRILLRSGLKRRAALVAAMRDPLP